MASDLERLIFGVSPDEYAPKPAIEPEGLSQNIEEADKRSKGLTGEKYLEGAKAGFIQGNTGDPLRDALINKQKSLFENDYNKLKRQYSDMADKEKLSGAVDTIDRSRLQRQFTRQAQLMQENHEQQKEMARSRALASIIGAGMKIGGGLLGGGAGAGVASAVSPDSSSLTMGGTRNGDVGGFSGSSNDASGLGYHSKYMGDLGE